MKCILILFLFSAFSINAQNVQSSKTYINTCFNEQQCFSLNNSSFIFYNNANHEITLSIDFNKFKIGNDTLDEWLDDLDDTKLIFKGNINTDNLLSLTHHNSKPIIVNGLISFNGISHTHSIEMTLFEISKEGMLFTNNQEDYFDRINVNLQFGFSPKEFKIHKKKHHLKKKITIAIYRGVINAFKPGMEKWIE